MPGPLGAQPFVQVFYAPRILGEERDYAGNGLEGGYGIQVISLGILSLIMSARR